MNFESSFCYFSLVWQRTAASHCPRHRHLPTICSVNITSFLYSHNSFFLRLDPVFFTHRTSLCVVSRRHVRGAEGRRRQRTGARASSDPIHNKYVDCLLVLLFQPLECPFFMIHAHGYSMALFLIPWPVVGPLSLWLLILASQSILINNAFSLSN